MNSKVLEEQWKFTFLDVILSVSEQGAESINAKLNSLKCIYCASEAMVSRKALSVMKGHYLSVAPRLSAAVPPVEKRKKKLTHESISIVLYMYV